MTTVIIVINCIVILSIVRAYLRCPASCEFAFRHEVCHRCRVTRGRLQQWGGAYTPRLEGTQYPSPTTVPFDTKTPRFTYRVDSCATTDDCDCIASFFPVSSIFSGERYYVAFALCCRKSVCLSVCRLSVTLLRITHIHG